MDMKFILGLKVKGLRMNNDNIFKNDLCNKYCDKKGPLPLIMLEIQIKEDIDGGDEFKVCFILFVLGVLLCNALSYFFWNIQLQ